MPNKSYGHLHRRISAISCDPLKQCLVSYLPCSLQAKVGTVYSLSQAKHSCLSNQLCYCWISAQLHVSHFSGHPPPLLFFLLLLLVPSVPAAVVALVCEIHGQWLTVPGIFNPFHPFFEKTKAKLFLHVKWASIHKWMSETHLDTGSGLSCLMLTHFQLNWFLVLHLCEDQRGRAGTVVTTVAAACSPQGILKVSLSKPDGCKSSPTPLCICQDGTADSEFSLGSK